MFDYMPSFDDDLGNNWELHSIDFVIMGFGRGLFIEAYCQELKQSKTFTYSYLKDEFIQFNPDEVVDCQPLDGNFQSICKKMFKAFDNKEVD